MVVICCLCLAGYLYCSLCVVGIVSCLLGFVVGCLCLVDGLLLTCWLLGLVFSVFGLLVCAWCCQAGGVGWWAMRLGCLGVGFGLLWFDCAFGGWFWLVGGGLIAGC